jgi:hypothetical protein
MSEQLGNLSRYTKCVIDFCETSISFLPSLSVAVLKGTHIFNDDVLVIVYSLPRHFLHGKFTFFWVQVRVVPCASV